MEHNDKIKKAFWITEDMDREIDMHLIGHTLMGTGKYQYLLPFEAVSVLLLACIVGGLLIARKRK